MSRATYITVSHADYLGTLLEDASAGGESNWTLSRHARAGDRVLLYLKAPISAIVAQARVAEQPMPLDEPSSPWHGHFCADLEALRMTPTRVPRDAILATFPEWRYWTQPRQSVRVPEEFEPMLLVMAGDTTPRRIQRKRTPGWRMPAGVVYVGRPGPFQNPFPVSKYGEAALAMYSAWMGGRLPEPRFEALREEALRRLPELKGKVLACWCAPGGPCHADLLLKLANSAEGGLKDDH